MQAADLARKRWLDLLTHFGVERQHLTGRHGPCPACGGRDRFRFDDKDGRGTYFCSHCGSGDGFALLGLVKGWGFKQAATEVERVVGTIQPCPPKRLQGNVDKLQACKRIWLEARQVIEGDPVARYLRNRCGIKEVPGCLRHHPGLHYRHGDGTVTRHPAMVAKVQEANSTGCAIHRTYLTKDGDKADVPNVKKIIGNLPPSSAVRLSQPSGCLGVAEGIETAISASLHFGVPVWAAISANGLEQWTPPAGIERVLVFGDNDKSGTGQAASWTLAKRLIASGIVTEVKIPEQQGADWNDVLVG